VLIALFFLYLRRRSKAAKGTDDESPPFTSPARGKGIMKRKKSLRRWLLGVLVRMKVIGEGMKTMTRKG
jgi:hypothetical protein